jgi:hypothetical protein
MPTYVRTKNNRISLLFAASVLTYSVQPMAQDAADDALKEVANFFALPIELEVDSGAPNGDASILRFMPLYSFPTYNKWKLVNLNLLTLADAPGGIPGQPGNPEPVPGNRVFGVSDLLHASFYTPSRSGNLIWGLGGLFMIPTASDSKLGSGKWSAGPAFRISYRIGLWNVGAFGGQSWSFAGDAHRKDVSQFIMRGTIRRQLPNNWYFVSAPIVTANWKASGEKWLVPVGGGFGKKFDVGPYPWAVSLQGYYNAIKPVGAPEWSVRLSMVAAIKLGSDQ